MKKRFIVIGASAASIAFITKLRSVDKNSEIICFSGEVEFPYNRCFLADVLTKEKTEEQLLLKPKDFFHEKNIDLRLNHWVTKIESEQQLVFVGDQSFSYDYLFIGTGTKPFMPPCEGELAMDGIFQFHTLQDIKKLSHFIEQKKPKTAVVVGGGLNGIECASALDELGVAVTIIEQSNQILPLQVDGTVARYILSVMQHNGVSCLTGHKVTKICSLGDQVGQVVLGSGASLDVDCVVFATGSKVQSELLQDTGILLESGSIIVDHQMRTNISNVFAGGDICVAKDCVTGEVVKSATWSDAMLQGLCAATQFSDKPRQYPGIIGLRDSQFFEQTFYACGKTVDHDDSYEIVDVMKADSLQRFYLKDNCLKGFVLVGDVVKISEYKKYYLTQQVITKEILS